ncbi:hypothetical protein HNY73_003132 [Argiope bruennichi]|uniref:Uncharacterized protein n=1 Tax=Argiope bruennichi TaxID=94029 RepID=A0A8T0FVZ3_ARGBR|nr:hypothetical protein HNY73_003132 [Argiope bruennichi]
MEHIRIPYFDKTFLELCLSGFLYHHQHVSEFVCARHHVLLLWIISFWKVHTKIFVVEKISNNNTNCAVFAGDCVYNYIRWYRLREDDESTDILCFFRRQHSCSLHHFL